MLNDADVIILGSGFSGSLIAQILCRTGRSVVMLDNGVHPRFAIGESSTPSANLILNQLAHRYDLEKIGPLSSYGRWQDTYPEIGCGIKRGFSYFKHKRGQEFQPDHEHENELLVAGSNNDYDSDTHWFRQDVDALFCRAASQAGVTVLQHATTLRIDHDEKQTPSWEIEVAHDSQQIVFRAGFVIDATGPAGVLRRFFDIPDRTYQLKTRSSAIYGHFRHVSSWHNELSMRNHTVTDYPFYCDHSAQHHLVDGSWFWMLRFNHGITSVGLVLDHAQLQRKSLQLSVDLWDRTLRQNPSVDKLLRGTNIENPPGKLLVSSQLQRMCGQAAGADWAMLPHTVGFIDPLHSMGIAHSLSGIERLATILERYWNDEKRGPALKSYQDQLLQEFLMMDRLVYGCYRAINHFPWFVSYSMLYFAAAIRYEQNRLSASPQDVSAPFMGADEPAWNRTVDQILNKLETDLNENDTSPQQAETFSEAVWKALEPFDLVGLSDSEVKHMYPHTALL